MERKKYLSDIINEGLGIMKQDTVTKEDWESWIYYSVETLKYITVENRNFILNYLKVKFNAEKAKCSLNDKMSMCLRYLIEIKDVI